MDKTMLSHSQLKQILDYIDRNPELGILQVEPTYSPHHKAFTRIGINCMVAGKFAQFGRFGDGENLYGDVMKFLHARREEKLLEKSIDGMLPTIIHINQNDGEWPRETDTASYIIHKAKKCSVSRGEIIIAVQIILGIKAYDELPDEFLPILESVRKDVFVQG